MIVSDSEYEEAKQEIEAPLLARIKELEAMLFCGHAGCEDELIVTCHTHIGEDYPCALCEEKDARIKELEEKVERLRKSACPWRDYWPVMIASGDIVGRPVAPDAPKGKEEENHILVKPGDPLYDIWKPDDAPKDGEVCPKCGKPVKDMYAHRGVLEYYNDGSGQPRLYLWKCPKDGDE